MTPSIKKTASGKTMRVATTFTGVAACAALFATPAMAGAAQPNAARPGHQPRLDGKALGLRPLNTQLGHCFYSPTWVHFVRYNGDVCFGFVGTWSVPPGSGLSTSSICGGNNYGWYAGWSKTGHGAFHTANFRQGTTFAHLPWPGTASITVVHISGWKGSDSC